MESVTPSRSVSSVLFPSVFLPSTNLRTASNILPISEYIISKVRRQSGASEALTVFSFALVSKQPQLSDARLPRLRKDVCCPKSAGPPGPSRQGRKPTVGRKGPFSQPHLLVHHNSEIRIPDSRLSPSHCTQNPPPPPSCSQPDRPISRAARASVIALKRCSPQGQTSEGNSNYGGQSRLPSTSHKEPAFGEW